MRGAGAIVISYKQRRELVLSRAPSGWNWSWQFTDGQEFGGGHCDGDFIDAQYAAERQARDADIDVGLEPGENLHKIEVM